MFFVVTYFFSSRGNAEEITKQYHDAMTKYKEICETLNSFRKFQKVLNLSYILSNAMIMTLPNISVLIVNMKYLELAFTGNYSGVDRGGRRSRKPLVDLGRKKPEA